MGAISAPIVAAGIAAAAQGGQAYAQGRMNRKTIRFNKEQALLQRGYALQDFDMVNAYNDPTAQMERLRKAGLNPALVYGNGATTEAGTVRASEKAEYAKDAPDYGSAATQGLAAYYNTQQQEAQTNNVKAQTETAKQEAILKASQTAATNSQTASTDFARQQAQRLADISAEAATENLNKLKNENKVIVDNNGRQTQLANASLRETTERILTSKLQRTKTEKEKQEIEKRIQNLDKDGKLKDLEIHLNQSGIQKNDPAWMRAILQFIDGKPADWIKNKYKETKAKTKDPWQYNPSVIP